MLPFVVAGGVDVGAGGDGGFALFCCRRCQKRLALPVHVVTVFAKIFVAELSFCAAEYIIFLLFASYVISYRLAGTICMVSQYYKLASRVQQYVHLLRTYSFGIWSDFPCQCTFVG